MLANPHSKLLDAIRPALLTDAGLLSQSDAPNQLLLWLSAGVLCFLAGYGGIWLGQTPAQADVIWPANGILLALLLQSPRRTWGGYLIAGFTASVLVHGVFHFPLTRSLVFSVANVSEILVAASLMWRAGVTRPNLTEWRTLGRFMLCGVFLAPFVSAIVVEFLRVLGGEPADLLGLWNWFMGDALGIAIMTPLLLAIHADELSDLISRTRRTETISLLSGLTVLSVLVFNQGRYPLAFLLLPALLLVIFRLRASGSAIGIFLIAIPAAYFTVQGEGPFALIRKGALIHSIFMLQCFFCVLLMIVYAVSAALTERDRLQDEMGQAYRQAQELLGLDHLTGLANRRAFDKELAREWRRAIREQGSLSLLMIDVDNFKLYNDHYGHPAGDQCLMAIAFLLSKAMVRSTDLVARYGGEEFAVILPGSHAEGAAIIAERFRQAIVQASLPHAKSGLSFVSVSIGVATLHPAIEMNSSQLLQAADEALYQAKKNGRDQIAIFPEST